MGYIDSCFAFRSIQRRFPPLEMHSTNALKFVSVRSFPRGTSIFAKLQGLEYYFPENFRCNLTNYESESFSDSSLHRFFESDNFRFPFFLQNIGQLRK